ncbi:hypothetical protein ABZ749_01100 [Micromonospora sp. NPDC047753]|uniref:hypothetical protein n=1 Tax=Micromonospora sp. NPDC047753 TaxID=3154817 RepID=UPI0033E4EFF9
MTPHHLHATAAAWSLHTARISLAVWLDREAAHNGAQLLDAAAVLRSPTWGTRHGVGGHGDPTGGLLTAAPRWTRETRWAEVAERLEGRIAWLANQVAPGAAPALGRLIVRIPTLAAGTARVVAQHLADEDAWIRDLLGDPPARVALLGVDCPHCGERQLYVQTAGPVDAWTVVCATRRLCTGQGCPCGMPGAVEGVAHIWPRDAVIGAVAGAAPTTERTDHA